MVHTPVDTVEEVCKIVDIPVVCTVTSAYSLIEEKLESGVKIINISAGRNTPEVVAYFRKLYPELPIMATGGPTDESIRATIQAGANAITYTPPSNGELFSKKMDLYRQQELEKYKKLY